jgi:hypothetical protein
MGYFMLTFLTPHMKYRPILITIVTFYRKSLQTSIVDTHTRVK